MTTECDKPQVGSSIRKDEHFLRLQSMYLSAPINDWMPPKISVGEGIAEISSEVGADMHHSANSLHGCIYFKLLDDAAYFAACTLEREYFMLTASFNLYFVRPVFTGVLTAKGSVITKTKVSTIAEARLFDDKDNQVASGSGVFMRSKTALTTARGY